MPPFSPDGILIDFYGTIAAGDREAVERTCRTVVDACGLDISPEQFAVLWGERYFATVDRSNHQAFRTLHECEIISLRATLETFGKTRDPTPLVVELEAYWSDPPLHADAVEFLRRVDRPVCCVSNADTKPLLAAIEKHGLRFDAVISSESVRCYKPQSRIFERALECLEISPERAIHIGDSLHSDIAGAKRAGIAAVWICRDDRIHDIGTAAPDRTISSFSGLALTFDV